MTELLVDDDPALSQALAAAEAAGLPPHQVSPTQGKLPPPPDAPRRSHPGPRGRNTGRLQRVVREGEVLEGGTPEADGARRVIEMAAADPRLDATAIQTVGTKGHDGFLIALVVAPEGG